MSRWLFVAFGVWAFGVFPASAAPIPANAPTATPTVVLQAKSAGYFLEWGKTYARSGGEEATKELQKLLEERLGEKGFTGLDMLRPMAGYGVIKPKLEQSYGVLVLPVSTDKEFLDLLDRLKFEYAESKETPGLYDITAHGFGLHTIGGVEVPWRFRFHDKHIYLGVNAEKDDLAVKNLVPIRTLINPAEQGIVAARVHLPGVDPVFVKLLTTKIDEWTTMVENDGNIGLRAFTKILVPLLKVLKRNVEAAAHDGETLQANLLASGPVGELGLELVLTGKPGTALTKEIAARKPSTSRFAGLMPKDAVGGAVIQAPLFAPELRAAGVEFLEEFGKDTLEQFKEQAPAELWPTFEEALKALVKGAKAGDLEAGFAMTGPDANGHFTVVAALGGLDPVGVEKAFRAGIAKAPKLVQLAVKLDAAKAGKLDVHTVAAGPLLPPEVQKVVGEQAMAYVAFGTDAVYIVIGPNGPAELTRAVGLKPGESNVLGFWVNPKRAAKLSDQLGEESNKALLKMLPDEDRLVPLYSLEIQGGKELRVRFTNVLGRANFPTGP